MSRPIKYRVWCKNFKEWEKDEILTDKFGNIFHCGKTGMRIVSPDSHVIQQFTGLKDKNNKEVYDGDIIKQNSHFGEILVCQYREKFGMWTFRIRNDGDSFHFHYWELKEFEVVGNIFENSELIENK